MYKNLYMLKFINMILGMTDAKVNKIDYMLAREKWVKLYLVFV